MKRFVAFVGLSMFAFVFFYVAAGEPPRPAPAPATPTPVSVTPTSVPVAAKQDEPKLTPSGIPRDVPATPIPTPPATMKSKKPKYKMFSRAYVGNREDVEEREVAEQP